jgi:hypothetical protein
VGQRFYNDGGRNGSSESATVDFFTSIFYKALISLTQNGSNEEEEKD